VRLGKAPGALAGELRRNDQRCRGTAHPAVGTYQLDHAQHVREQQRTAGIGSGGSRWSVLQAPLVPDDTEARRRGRA
jgi:hypothetical protein